MLKFAVPILALWCLGISFITDSVLFIVSPFLAAVGVWAFIHIGPLIAGFIAVCCLQVFVWMLWVAHWVVGIIGKIVGADLK